jgi:hypothetical protein
MLVAPSHVQVGTLTRRLGDMEADLAAAVATASQSAATLDQVKSMALQVRGGPGVGACVGGCGCGCEWWVGGWVGVGLVPTLKVECRELQIAMVMAAAAVLAGGHATTRLVWLCHNRPRQ